MNKRKMERYGKERGDGKISKNVNSIHHRYYMPAKGFKPATSAVKTYYFSKGNSMLPIKKRIHYMCNQIQDGFGKSIYRNSNNTSSKVNQLPSEWLSILQFSNFLNHSSHHQSHISLVYLFSRSLLFYVVQACSLIYLITLIIC